MAFHEMKYRFWIVAFVIIGLFVGIFYLASAPSQDKSPRSVPAVETTVRVARVRRATFPVELKVSGELMPVKQTEIRSRVAGQVAEIRFKVGDLVPAGAVVAVIRSSELEQRVGRLEAAVTGAREDLRRAEEQSADVEKRLRENRDLMRRDLIARRDLEQMETAAETARAQADLARAHLAQQEAMLAQARSLQSLSRLSAPVSGMVSHRLVEPGSMMGENGTILILVGLETLKLTAKVPGGAAGDLLRGTAAQVSAPTLPGVISRGKVVRYGMRVDGAETFLEVEVLVDNRHRFFRPGMAVEARIDSGRQQEHLLVPRSAVRSENNNNYIYRIIDERASRQNAVLGPEHGEEIVIVQGLEEGDSVIADHLETLNPGGQIRPLDRKINHQ